MSGTTLALIVIGTAASRLREFTAEPRWRRVGGALVVYGHGHRDREGMAATHAGSHVGVSCSQSNGATD